MCHSNCIQLLYHPGDSAVLGEALTQNLKNYQCCPCKIETKTTAQMHVLHKRDLFVAKMLYLKNYRIYPAIRRVFCPS